MRAVVIGCGVSGLVACKYALETGIDVTVFEQSKSLGGIWVYSEENGINNYGLKVHSSLYKNLKTNLPKEVMGFQDFPFDGYDRSFVTHEEVLQFLHRYADHFGLKEKIKFEHHVEKIEPDGQSKWSVTVKDLLNDKIISDTFDAVFVCNGHYFEPKLPQIDGIKYFNGKIMHSQEYRRPEVFKGQTILVVGAGFSGIDIAMDLSSSALHVYFSHHSTWDLSSITKDNIIHKSDILRILENGSIQFKDESTITSDLIIFCTGYKYNFPFLSPKCGIKLNDNHVTPLFKHVININYPTMCFIGLPTSLFYSMDCQVRFFMQYLTNAKELPTKEEMLKDMKNEITELDQAGVPPSKRHILTKRMRSYLNDLAATADMEHVRPVVLNVFERATQEFFKDLRQFRNNKYQIVDEDNFIFSVQ